MNTSYEAASYDNHDQCVFLCVLWTEFSFGLCPIGGSNLLLLAEATRYRGGLASSM